MKHSEYIANLTNSLSAWIQANFEQSDLVSVDTYRMELSELATDERFFFRVALYDAGEAVKAGIPGMGETGERVDTGIGLWTIQQYGIQASLRITVRGDYGDYNELDLVELKDVITAWTQDMCRNSYQFSAGYAPMFVYGGSDRVIRPTPGICQTTMTVYAKRQLQTPDNYEN